MDLPQRTPGWFLRKLLPGMPRTIIQGLKYQKIQFDYRSYLRDEAGIIADTRSFVDTEADTAQAAR